MNREASLLHELPLHAALGTPGAAALHDGAMTLSYAELAARMRDLAPFTPNVTAGVLAKYAALVSSASDGAVTAV